MDRKTLFDYAEDNYGALPEYLWKRYPDLAVLRHNSNKKWFALVMRITGDKLGLDDNRELDIVNVKCESAVIGSLRSIHGIYAAYHMNKGNWISVAPDSGLEDDFIFHLIDRSYELTKSKIRKKPAAKESGN